MCVGKLNVFKCVYIFNLSDLELNTGWYHMKAGNQNYKMFIR